METTQVSEPPPTELERHQVPGLPALTPVPRRGRERPQAAGPPPQVWVGGSGSWLSQAPPPPPQMLQHLIWQRLAQGAGPAATHAGEGAKYSAGFF